MGELVAGTPALRLEARASLAMEYVSALVLLYRAVPGSGLDPWLIAARRSLPDDLRYDLDLLHGFSGRLVYYLEEPLMRYEPFSPEHEHASFGDLMAFLEGMPPESYAAMAIRAIQRVRADQGLDQAPPVPTGNELRDEIAWRRFIEPGLTTATSDEVLPLFQDPGFLREKTIRLFRGVWDVLYREEYARQEPILRRAAERAAAVMDRGFGLAFSDLTGNRIPATLLNAMNSVNRVIFCPSAHLGSFVSYVLYPPDLVVLFSAPLWLERVEDKSAATRNWRSLAANGATKADGARTARALAATRSVALPGEIANDELPLLSMEEQLDMLRALADPTRLRILDMLVGGERYAREIVEELAIAQSAVSRHLSQLERAGLITVRPKGGMKYYSLDPTAIPRLAESLMHRFDGS